MKRPFEVLFIAVAMLLTGCSKEPSMMPAIRISPTIASRVTPLNFESGDCIGLQVARADDLYTVNAPHDPQWELFCRIGVVVVW